MFDLFTFPLPTACAIAGHAPAGGTVLALACDYRFAASGRKLIGLNEVQLGLPVPQITDSIMRQIVGDREATELLYQGDLIEPARAQQIGLVDEIHPLEEVEDRAVEKIAKLAALPHPALTAIKANRVEAVRLTYEKNKEIKNQEFLDCWFSQPVQELLAKTAEKF
ncbi:MAG: enoyl-CoA hydratase/isomerase family protein [Deltaproteobacteria bacterium]|nr:enoyl-CoA hydratase/isomerase family protein [Deltaproteobacteria bacterium]